MTDDRADHEAWPLRPVILLLLGAIAGLAINAFLTEQSYVSWSKEPGRLAGATFVAVAGLGFAFTLERLRWTWSLAFALGCGLVLGAVVYWNGGPEGWRLPSALLAIGIAAPLFQVVRDEGCWHLAQRPIHAHAWANAVLWCATWLFVLIVYLLVLLLSQLFALIGIDILKTALGKGWFNWMLIGASLGAAAGLLRDRDKILGLLQRVVTVVLSMLSPFLAVGLGLFILSLPFTGLEPLWRETSATTPILLSCALVALLFANATIGNAADEEPRHPVLRVAALVLAAVVLPLAVVAAISTGMRIGQYGFTPDRLWAGICIAVAVGYGVAYLVAVGWGRARWPDRLRQLNVWLALGVCGLALVLATPVIDFGAISARDQLARLSSGRTTVADFDWQAMAFDFGPSGKRALERLKLSGATADIRKEAALALAADSRWDLTSVSQRKTESERVAELRVLPRQIAIPEGLRTLLAKNYACSSDRPCTILLEEGSKWALAAGQPGCLGFQGNRRRPGAQYSLNEASPKGQKQSCESNVTTYVQDGTDWRRATDPESRQLDRPQSQNLLRGWQEGDIRIGEVKRRQLFIGDQPVGDVFE